MDFYRIQEDYIEYLQKYETDHRGFTRVPNICYGRGNKFAFGAVLSVNGFSYYVAVSSFDKKQEANILIRIPGDRKEIKGSLRFNYMIPIPNACMKRLVIRDISDEKYRLLLNKEYMFCRENEERIRKKANKIYEMVVQKEKPKLTDNSCDFKLLEMAYQSYIETFLSSNLRYSNYSK